jgi:hypothetical protein
MRLILNVVAACLVFVMRGFVSLVWNCAYLGVTCKFLQVLLNQMEVFVFNSLNLMFLCVYCLCLWALTILILYGLCISC